MNISKIWTEHARNYRTDADKQEYLKLRKLNLLIGPNNSGKSRLLRSLFSAPLEKVSIGLGSEFCSASENLGDIYETIKNHQKINDFTCASFLALCREDCINIGQIRDTIESFKNAVSHALNINVHSTRGGGIDGFSQLQKIVRTSDLTKEINEVLKLGKEMPELNRHYIPILRGMRPLGEGTDLFLERTYKDYFSNSNKAEVKIVTGFNLYRLLTQFLLGQPKERERIREYEKILGNEFFGGADVTLIPQYEKDTVAVKIGNDEQFPIFDLGDGLQQVIIITSAAYLEKNYSIFFIEEPEACLHPGLLRKLALFLLAHTNHQYIVTTHSNHLLDLAENDQDILIHRVSKNSYHPENGFDIQECTRDREILADLGVRASSVYLANSTIWLEGITDRLYLKTFMNKYLQSLLDENLKIKLEGLLENFHYAFVEYQGGTLGHWGFDDGDTTERLNASKLCSAAFLIADGDILEKGERVETLKTELEERFHLLPSKEIENLLPVSIIEKVAQQIFKRKKSKTIAGLDSSNIKKILNQNIEKSEYGIGHHLDTCLGLEGKGKENRRIFSDESGTINEKVKFCREAIRVMETEEWELPTALEELCTKIYDHIMLNNH
ncbi:AAA family ATPase [Pseudomonas quasicaspiana]|uniref:AAA family ATPase n=1 Tax=Pseudomonas quasicaspiana TaxID=2829821 RepID=UPI001E436EDA|nr:AAA family ATPase [Pseudomonas quasicaspiana]MCD5973137.1 ATP-binding protein [Pseudomonas quasicaspiana]